jgi:O-Antigen ligase
LDNTLELGARAARQRALPIVALVGLGTVALAAGAVAGGNAVAVGAFAFVLSAVLAFGQTVWPVVTWPNALLVFIAVLWFVPIKLYSFPIDLPFELELYRVLLGLLMIGFVVDSLVTKRPVEAFSASKPLFVLAAVALTTQIINAGEIDVAGSEGQALKSLSLFLSLIIVFLLFASVLDTFREIEFVTVALVLGAVVVAIAALYEGQRNYNVFDHLAQWVPIFERNEREVLELRGGRLRVHASAQHPIAFGAALLMILPFAIYFAAKARTRMARGWWVAGMLVIAAAAAATISRTTVIMAVVMAIAALAVRRQAVVKLLPLLLVLPIFVHAAAPGAIGGLLSSFGSQEGTDLIGSLNSRAGESGSGRLADLDPAIDLWLQSPIVGLGLDNPNIATSVPQDLPAAVPVVPLIFDNQYLLSLVTFGLVGLIAFLWFIWGTARRLLKYAKRAVGDEADYIAACGIACAGYGAGMFFYDALAFVQVTLLLFIFAALGLKTLSLRAEQPAPASP